MNFRDLGGIEAGSGCVVRRGVLYRSGELNALTAGDLGVLRRLGLRTIFDLRTSGERTAAPMNWGEDAPETIRLPVGFGADEDPSSAMKIYFAQGVNVARAREAMAAVTAKIALDGAREIGQVIRAIGGGKRPALIHCTAGKDRTGAVSAMLLLLLGASKETLYRDYLRSNDVLEAQVDRFRKLSGALSGMPPAIAAMPLDTIRILLGVERGFLDAAFAAIDERYGSFEEFTAAGLQISAGEIAQLRAALLEPAV